MKPRVLHLIDTGGPGGAETVYLDLVQHLPTVGWDSIPVVPAGGWLEQQLHASGADPVRVASARSFDALYARKLQDIARRHGVQLIQTHLLGSAVYGSIVGRILDLPVICTFHGTPDFQPGRLRRLKFWLIDRGLNRLVFVSKYLQDQFRSLGTLKHASSVVVHNGINMNRLSTISRENLSRRDLGIPEGAFLVGAIGNVRPAKAYPDLLRTASILHDHMKDWHFVVVGDTEHAVFDELLSLRSELRLEENVHFVGFRSDIPAVLKLLDVFCLPSTSEGFSLVTVQAMICDVPVVATRSGGPEEIISHNETGLLVDPGSPSALAEALRSVRADPDGARHYATKAQNVAQTRFDLSHMILGYDRIYRDILYG